MLIIRLFSTLFFVPIRIGLISAFLITIDTKIFFNVFIWIESSSCWNWCWFHGFFCVVFENSKTCLCWSRFGNSIRSWWAEPVWISEPSEVSLPTNQSFLQARKVPSNKTQFGDSPHFEQLKPSLASNWSLHTNFCHPSLNRSYETGR